MNGKYFFMRGMLIAALALAVLAGCRKSTPEPALSVGSPFPPIMLGGQGANALAAPGLQGKVLVLNVWATWCPPCRREMPGLERLSKTLDANRFAVLGMSTDADENLAAEFLMQNGITFANFFDNNGQLARKWGMQVYPETFLIAPDGTLLRRVAGFREWDSPEVMAELEAAYQQSKGGLQRHVN